MPDFDLRLVVVAGVDVNTWTDPVIAAAPSRLNPRAAYQHKYLRIKTVGAYTIQAGLGAGVWAPLDAALGGRLFQYSWVHWSGSFPPPIVQPAGQSSVANFTIGTEHAGHFSILCWRETGGAIALPFDVEYTP